MAAHRGTEPGAEEGVDHQTGRAEFVQGRQQSVLIGHECHLAAHPRQNIEIDGSIADDRRRFGEYQGLHLPSPVEQMPGNDIAVAAVVPLPRQNQHGSGKEFGIAPGQPLGRPPPGIFHEDHTGDAEIFDGLTVEFTHPRGGQQFHGRSRITVALA